MNKIKELNKHNEILESIKSLTLNDSDVIVIYGKEGSGKTTLLKDVTTTLRDKDHIIFQLSNSNKVGNIQYEVFLQALDKLSDDDSGIKFKDLLITLSKGVSTVADKAIDVYNLYEESKDKNKIDFFTENENNILSVIKLLTKSKIIYFVCDDFDKWEENEQMFLKKIVQYKGLEFKRIFISRTNSDKKFFKDNDTSIKKFELKQIDKEYLPYILDEFNYTNKPSPMQIDLLYTITENNLNMLKELATFDLNKLDNKQYNDLNIFDILLDKISEDEDIDKNYMAEFLKKTALVETSIHTKLHRKILYNLKNVYDFYLATLIDEHFLNKNEPWLKFENNQIREFIKNNIKRKDIGYYSAIAEGIRALYPTDYKSQYCYLLKANKIEDAMINRILYELQQFRLFNLDLTLEDDLDHDEKENYLEFLKQYKNLYQLYNEQKFDQIKVGINQMYYKEIPEFDFEIQYLDTLYVIHYDKYKNSFLQKINYFEAIYQNKDCKNKNPEQWIRGSLILVELYYHNGDLNKLENCVGEIKSYITSIASTDKMIQKQLYILDSKSTIYESASILIAYSASCRAVAYFEKINNSISDLKTYYYILVNHSGYALLLSKFDEVIELYGVVFKMIEMFPHVKFIKQENIINNYLLAKYLSNDNELTSVINDFEHLINDTPDSKDKWLIENNLVALLAINGDKQKAFELSNKLYKKICGIEIDEYYKFYIYNNYAIISYILGNDEIASTIFKSIKDIKLYPADNAHFENRYALITNILTNKISLDVENFNDILFVDDMLGTGELWKLWGKLFLFSDLQIWADCIL